MLQFISVVSRLYEETNTFMEAAARERDERQAEAGEKNRRGRGGGRTGNDRKEMDGGSCERRDLEEELEDHSDEKEPDVTKQQISERGAERKGRKG